MADKCADAMTKTDRVNNQVKKLEISKDQKKNLYAHVKQAKSKTSSVGPIKDDKGVLRSTDQEMSTSFSDLLGDQLKPTYSWKSIN